MKYNNKKIALILVATIALLASCGKVYDLNGFDWEPDTPPSDSVYNRYIQVLDLGKDNLPEGHRPVDVSDPILFSLEKFSSIHLGYKISDRWDIAGFTANNGSVAGPGYGSTGIGGVVLLDSAFSEVTTVPDDLQFRIPGSYGLDNFMGSGPGFSLYTYTGNPFQPQMVEWAYGTDREKQAIGNQYLHMIYYLSEDLAKAFPEENSNGYVVHPKTLIIRTAKGNYAKLEVQSYYKGTMDPKEMRRGTDKPGGYNSFRYMVIKAEEKRFGFVEHKPPLTVDFTNKTVTAGKMN